MDIRLALKSIDKGFGLLDYKLTQLLLANNWDASDPWTSPTDVVTSSSGSSPSLTADYKSPGDFSAEYLSSDSITLSGLPFSIDYDTQLAYIKYVDGTDSGILVNGANSVTLNYAGGVVRVAGSGFTDSFSSDTVFEVGINSQTKSYDSTTKTILTSVLNPEFSHYTSIETFTDENLADATTTYYEVSMESYKNLYLQLGGTNVTFTLEATGDESLWDDVSTEFLGAASFATTSADSESYFLNNVMPKKFRVKALTTSATNATTINIRMY